MGERWQGLRVTVAWWLLAIGVAVALKLHFSAAATSDLEWMLRPMALLLRIVTGWRFMQSGSGEWYSLDAGIILVKACAGINFMTLSFLGWCWLCRPRYRIKGPMALAEWPVLLVSALVMGWLMALLVNSLRIIAIVHWQPVLEHWLAPVDAHRSIGLTLYVAALNLQLLAFDRRRWRRSVWLACGGYALLMIGVPFATGNGFREPTMFVRHLLSSLLILLPFVALASVRWGNRHGSRAGDRK